MMLSPLLIGTGVGLVVTGALIPVLQRGGAVPLLPALGRIIGRAAVGLLLAWGMLSVSAALPRWLLALATLLLAGLAIGSGFRRPPLTLLRNLALAVGVGALAGVVTAAVAPEPVVAGAGPSSATECRDCDRLVSLSWAGSLLEVAMTTPLAPGEELAVWRASDPSAPLTVSVEDGLLRASAPAASAWDLSSVAGTVDGSRIQLLLGSEEGVAVTLASGERIPERGYLFPERVEGAGGEAQRAYLTLPDTARSFWWRLTGGDAEGEFLAWLPPSPTQQAGRIEDGSACAGDRCWAWNPEEWAEQLGDAQVIRTSDREVSGEPAACFVTIGGTVPEGEWCFHPSGELVYLDDRTNRAVLLREEA